MAKDNVVSFQPEVQRPIGGNGGHAKPKDLKGFFQPQGVAVIGASSSPAKIGYQILNNIILGGFAGGVYPINPREKEILGRQAYPSVAAIPGAVDLAVITIPAPGVMAAMEECAQKGIKNAAVITSGFGEVGGIETERKLKEYADQKGIAFLGPNILGLLHLPAKLNATFGPTEVFPGKIAFISQSGALAIALMGWTVMEKIGLASLFSIGNKADVGEKELIEYYNHDPSVDVILIYLEGLRDARKFFETEIKKPVVVLKVGCSQRGAKAAASHTGSLAGSDGIYDAAFRQMGIMRARSFTEAFGWARAFSLPLPQGEEVLIITNGGGIGVSTTDECEAAAIRLFDDSEWMEAKFRATMPSFGSTKNPIDITGQGGVEGYRKAMRVAFQEDKIKNVIVLYCETAVTNPVEIAQALMSEYEAAHRNKPVVVAMVGGERSRQAINYLNERLVPAFNSVNEAVSSLKGLHLWREISQRPKETAAIGEPPREVLDLIQKLKAEGRQILLEHEARQVLEWCGVPTPKWGFASSLEEALKAAEEMYPLAMKIASPDIVHKTDVGGVALNIQNAYELTLQYNNMMRRIAQAAPRAKILGVNLIQMVQGVECIVGLSQDAQFGPVIMFGLGGIFVEVLKDISFRVVPFGPREAERLINEIKSKKILDGFRGMKAHKPSIIQTLCAVQKLAPWFKEIDINPLISNAQGSYAVDARIVL
jgi:acetate---CoA ligase (ADP-forming)